MFIKKFDLYGYSVPIHTLGHEKYNTWCGFSLTLISVVIVLVCSILFGEDLFFKKNPRIISSEEFPKDSEAIFVNSANFTIAWTYEEVNATTLTDETKYAWPVVSYYSFKRNEKGEMLPALAIYSEPKPCSQTRAVENLTLPPINLDVFHCVDFDDIKKQGGFETDVPLYGEWDEDTNYYIVMQNTSCKFNYQTQTSYDCLSKDEVLEREKQTPNQYIYFYIPRFNFKPSSFEEPINMYVETTYFKLSPFGTLHEEVRYSKVTIENDVGWIFSDLINYDAIEKTIYKPAYSFLSQESFSSEQGANMYSLDFMFTRKQLLYKRSYMKVQELAAAVRGIFKFVSQVFGLVGHLVGSWIVDNELVSTFFKLEQRDDANIGEDANRSDSNIVRNINKKEIKIGFCRLYSNMICRKKTKFSEARANIASALDAKKFTRIT